MSAMNAKTSSDDVDEPELLVDRVLVLLGERLAGDHLVLTVAVGARASLRCCSCTWSCETPGLATTEICENWSDAFARRCASGSVNSVDRRAGEAVDGAELRDADERRTSAAPCVREDRHPVADVRGAPLSALCLSIDDLDRRCRGACPATRWNWLSFGFGSQPKPSVGGPLPGCRRLAVLVDELRVRSATLPTAAATPSASSARSSTSDAGTCGRCAATEVAARDTSCARTTASVPR